MGGIRSRLLVLVLGVALPITSVGLIGIWAMWDVSRKQLDGSIRNEAEIAGAAFEQWIEAQREPLTSIAAQYAERRGLDPVFLNILRSTVTSRKSWLGLRVVNASGETITAQPANAPSLQPGIATNMMTQFHEREWAVDTDWSHGPAAGTLLISQAVGNTALVAQLDVTTTSESFLKRVKLPDQAVFAVLGPQRRIILYRNAAAEAYLGRDMSDSPLLAGLANSRAKVIELTSPIDGLRRVYGVGRAGDTGCVVAVGIPSNVLYGPAQTQFKRYLLFSIAGSLLAMLAASLLARGIAGPVRQLSDATRRFESGDYFAQASKQASGELEDLRLAFNSMVVEIGKREARLTELDRLKSDFVAGVSHEMRTPLTTIKTLTSVLLRGNVSEADRHDYLETIMAECDRQIDLVLNLLDLSRIEAGTFNITLSPVHVEEVIQSCVDVERHNAEARHQCLEVRHSEHTPVILADRAALRRVLSGLVQNAMKYTPDGGRIVIAAAAEAGEVKIMVTDTGRGISEEDAPHVFEKFYRGRFSHAGDCDSNNNGSAEGAEPPGVGLGLYLARRIIEEIGGQIAVISRLAEGSTFVITLPARDIGAKD